MNLYDDEHWMLRALELASEASVQGEVPVGALVVNDNVIISEAFNSTIMGNDPSAHAEVLAIRRAAEVLGNYRLDNCELYVSLEPCTMCYGLMVHARIRRLVFAAFEPKAGVIESQLKLPQSGFYNHRFEVKGGVLADESAQMLRAFFAARRKPAGKIERTRMP